MLMVMKVVLVIRMVMLMCSDGDGGAGDTEAGEDSGVEKGNNLSR